MRGRGLIAGAATLWQSVGSFVLQIVAARLLGAAGLGSISLGLGVMVLATAVCSGVVGDTAIILDRRDAAIRGGLQAGAVVVLAGSALVAAVFAGGVGWDPLTGLAFTLALVAFAAEELVRRLLGANLRYGRLVVLDTSALVGSLLALGVLASVGPLQVADFFWAVLAGQLLGLGVGARLLPAWERWWAPWGGGWRGVLDVGLWRGLQVGIPQLIMSGSRLMVLGVGGAAALGNLEAARILVAPVLLFVQGTGSFLLPSFAADRAEGRAGLRRRARRAAAVLVLLGAGLGLLLGPVAVLAAPMILGPGIAVDPLAVGMWVAYGAALGSLQPFGALAALWGRQRLLVGLRLADASAALCLVWLVVAVWRQPVAFVPGCLALGIALGGLALRVLVDRLVDEAPREAVTTMVKG